jgi:hypothetical protein
MQYYRRKPLNLTAPKDLLQAQPASILDLRPRLQSSEAEAKRTENGSGTLDKLVQSASALEASAPDSQMADPAALVQQAADILVQELIPTLSQGAVPQTASSQPIRPLPTPTNSLGMMPDVLTNAHRFVDQFARVIAQRPMTMELMSAGSLTDDENHLPILKSPSVQAGALACLSFKVHNDSDYPVEAQFFGTDLVSPAGDRIPSSRIVMTPQRLALSADQLAEVSIRIEVPLGIPANTYFGLAIASNLSDLAAAIRLTIQ